MGLSFPLLTCTFILRGMETYGTVALFPFPEWHRLPSHLGTDVSEDLKPLLPLDQPVPAECTQCSELLLPQLLPCAQGCLTVFQTVMTLPWL